MNSYLILTALLITHNLTSMQCHKKNTLLLEKISHKKPHHTIIEHIPHFQLTPSALTFQSHYNFVAGTRIDQCKMQNKILIDPTHQKTIKIYASHKNIEYLYIQAKHEPSKKLLWFEIQLKDIK